MLKRSIGLGVLCFAGHAYSADIILTTTEDIVKDDKECSLREAIAYVNQDMPEQGYFGCGGKASSANIIFEKKATYKLNDQIKISAAVNLRTLYDLSFNDNKELGLNNAIIQMVGKNNIFYIDDQKKDLIKVSLTEITLQGCSETLCAEQGGLIYNNEFLALDRVKFTDGKANQGGAIYNAALPVEGNPDIRSLVEIKYSLFEHNKAQQGAILYSQVPQFRIANSVFRDNHTMQNTAANIYSAQQLDAAALLAFPLMSFKVSGSTFYNNKGPVINVRDGMGLNNLTIVGNTSGIQFNAPAKKAYLANSIVLGNPYPSSQDDNCNFNAEDQSYIQNNLVTASCGLGDASYPNDLWSGTQLIAGEALEGECKTLSVDQTSLLCPYTESESTFLGYFRPRILMNHHSLSDSLILNKGRLQLNSNAPLMGCEAGDQRDERRHTDNSFCDRGAIEIIVPSSTGLVGKDLLVGEIATIPLAEHLGDSDLVPKEQCDAILGKNPTGEPWQAGCVQVLQNQTVSKGQLSVNEEGILVYTPRGGWRGADLFKIRLVTSSTRFNQTNPYMELSVNIVQEAKNDMQSSKVTTSGGSFGWLSLFALFGLLGLRRYKNNEG